MTLRFITIFTTIYTIIGLIIWGAIRWHLKLPVDISDMVMWFELLMVFVLALTLAYMTLKCTSRDVGE